MSKKIYFLISFVLVLALANSASAQPVTYPAAYWSGFGSSPNSWDDANNWWTVDAWWDEGNSAYPTVPGRIWAKAPNSVPDADTIVMVGQGTPWYEYPAALAGNTIGYPVIDGETAVCYQIYISTGPNDTNGPGRLDVSGGTLTSRVYSDDWLGMQIGNVPNGVGTVNLSGGDILLDNYDGEGGLLTVGGNNYWNVAAGGGIGTLTMTGGTLSCYHLDCPDSDGLDNGTMIGYINLHGGTFYTTADVGWTEFWLGDEGTFPESRVDVTNGRAIIKTNELYWIDLWFINEGKITAFGGVNPRAELYADYDITNPGSTTLAAWAPDSNDQAWRPRPSPGSRVGNLSPTLIWAPGDNAVQHDVYFGTSWADVNNDTAPNTLQGPNSYTPGGFLAFDTPYFWKIDEVNASGGAEWPGAIWFFTTIDHIVVDDMDSYYGIAGHQIHETWLDYRSNSTGSEVYLWQGVSGPAFVRDGNSMRFYYRNTLKTGGSDWRGSKAEASTTDLECGSNWDLAGIKGLSLWFYGDLGNLHDNQNPADDQMYVALETGAGSWVVSEYPDMNHIKEASWHEWNIELQDFNDGGVTLSNVTKMYIGFGGNDEVGQTARGAGYPSGTGDTVYFDDIRMYRTRCVAAEAGVTDVTGDCITDYQDIDVLADDWLEKGFDILATPPSTDPNRLVRYTFDTEGGSGLVALNTGSLGSAANGTLSTSPPPTAAVQWITTGAAHPDACDPNYSVNIQGHQDAAVTMDANLHDIVGGGFTTNHLTITCWIKRDGDQIDWTGLVFATNTVGDSNYPDPQPRGGLSLGDAADWEIVPGMGIPPSSINHLAYHWINCPDENDATPEDFDEIWWWRSGLLVPNDLWTFCAVVVEPEQASLYMMPAGEGMYKSVNIETHLPSTFANPFNIGRDGRVDWGNRAFNGQIDDVQIYDYALSDSEILYVQGTSSTHVPLLSLVDFDNSDNIDFRDYRFMADNWLDEILFPSP